MGDLDRVVRLRASTNGLERAEPRDCQPAWVPLHDVNRDLGIPLTSLRRYLDRHGRYLPTMKAGKKIMIARSALPVVERIRMLYDQGRTVAAVEDELGVAAAVGQARADLAEMPAGSPASLLPRSLPPAPQPAERIPTESGAIEGLAAGSGGAPLAEMRQQVANLDRRLSEMQAAIETRDVMIRRILSAVVHVIEAHDNERRFADNERHIADDERDRQSAHRHQQLMLSLQEVLGYTRRRRWLW